MQALSAYPMRFRRVDLISHGTNYIYRASAQDGALYALRLVAPRWRTESNLIAEVTWLDALSRDTTIPVPRIIPTSTGDPFVRLHPGHGRPDRRAVLMSWLPGMLLGRRLTAANVRKMGELFARLHAHAQDWDVPADFPEQSFESFLSRGEDNLLFAEECASHYQPADLAVLNRAVARVDAAYRDLDRDDLRVIHCDLWHDNIKIYKGALAPFDFEDTILGHRIHDIAMAMLDLAEDVGTDQYEGLLVDFKRGYESLLPFPEGDLLSYQLGRVLWQINWFARFAMRYFAQAAAFKIGILRNAMAAGKLVGPLST